MVKRNILLGILILLGISLVSAGISVGNYTLEKNYGPGDFVQGKLNVSFSNVLLNSFFTGFNKTTSLQNLLNVSSFSYSCVPSDCSFNYAPSSSFSSKTFSLGTGQTKLIGVKLNGDVNSIQTINFTLNSGVGSSCSNQLEIDLGVDGKIDGGNSKMMPSVCSITKSYGCLNLSSSFNEFNIGYEPYCQRVRLSESPGFRIGVWIKKVSGNQEIIMTIYSLSGEDTGANCQIPNSSITSVGGEVSCNVEYLVKETGDYYVCVHSESGSSKIRGYSGGERCGFYGSPVQPELGSYHIFAEGLRFDSVGELKVPDKNSDFISQAESYLIKNYGFSMNCPSEGCIYPILIKSSLAQSIRIENLMLEYNTASGLISDNPGLFYELSQSPAKINSGYVEVDLENLGITVPENYGNYTLNLKLGEENILSEVIVVGNVPRIKSIDPMNVISGIPTEFIVEVENENNISLKGYEWYFGDNSSTTSLNNKITHTYNGTNIYQLKVVVEDANNRKFSKTFNIIVGSAKEAIAKNLEEKLALIGKLKTEVAKFPKFEQESIKKILDVDKLNEDLKSIQKKYTGAGDDEDEYTQLIQELIGIKVPRSLGVSSEAKNFIYYPEVSEINLDYITDITGEEIKSSGDYKEAVVAWGQRNYEMKINFKEISANYEYDSGVITNIIELNLKEKTGVVGKRYLIISLEDIYFKDNYLQQKKEGYNYIELKDAESSISFSTSEEMSITNLPVFISPKISELSVVSVVDEEEKEGLGKWFIFILIIIFILILFLIVYVIVQEWYKRKYEDYLFKNKRNLANLLGYISASEKKGLEREAIEKNLRKNGWNSEQIRYAMRKQSGKNTGLLFEVPVGKVYEKLSGLKEKIPFLNKKKEENSKFPKRFMGYKR